MAATVCERDARADRVGAVAEQAGDRVRVAGVAGVDDERRRAWRIRSRDQAVVDRAGASSDGIGARSGPTFSSVTTRMPGAGLHGVDAVARQRLEAVAAGPPGPRQIGNDASSSTGGERVVRRVEQRVDGVGVEEEGRELEQARRVAVLGEQRPARTETGAQRHHQALAEVVDRRVGDLGEALLQVVEDRARRGRRPRRTACRRPSRTSGSLASVAMGLSTMATSSRFRPNAACSGTSSSAERRHVDGVAGQERQQAVARPVAVGRTRREPTLDRGVVLPARVPGRGRGRVDAQHLARAEPAALDAAPAR